MMIVNIRDDFDLQRIAESGQCFRWERVDERCYRILHGNHYLYVEELPGREFAFSCDEEEFHAVWDDYFDLQENYARIRSRIDPKADPFLYRAAEQESGIRILQQDPWEMLITFIISQNRNIPAIRRSVELLAEAAGEKKTDCRGMLYFSFPVPAAIAALSEEQLKACRLGYRWKYVQAASEAVLKGKVDLEKLRDADEEKTIAALRQIHGVGIKVANCVSLFGLHHIDAFPQDVWIKRILAEQYPEGYPFETYSPYNGIYQQYMFAYYRNMKGLRKNER